MTRYVFDGLGRTTEEQKAGQTTTHAYDAVGNEFTTNAAGDGIATPETDRTFDRDANLLTETVDPDGAHSVTTYVYDALGREYSSTDPAGLTTTTTFDGVGRTKRSEVGASITDTGYDRDAEAVWTTSPHDAGAAHPIYTRTAYDGAGKACRSVANAVLGGFPKITSVRVTVHKPHAPIAAIFNDVGVSILRKRQS